MAKRRTIARLISIQRVLVRYGLDDVIRQTHLLRPLRFIFCFFPRRRDSSAPLGERIRLALEELGPIFIKFGQAISTRRDLLPLEVADELAKLQDEVPPFPAEQAMAILSAAYGKPLDEVFARFDVEPFAAASIAQVHTAALPGGTEVIVKLLRPGVQRAHRARHRSAAHACRPRRSLLAARQAACGRWNSSMNTRARSSMSST